MKNGGVEDEGVEFAVFATGIGVEREITEEGSVEFAAGEAGVEDFGIDASGDGAEMVVVEITDEFSGVALPEGEEGGHADAGEIFFSVGAEIFEEDVSEGHGSNALVVEVAEGCFHSGFVNGVDALRRDEHFMQRQAERFGLAVEKGSTDTVNGDAVFR